MNRRRTMLAFALALLLSLLFTFLMERKLEKTSSSSQTPIPTRLVLVATKNLHPGDVVLDSSVRSQYWPSGLIQADLPGQLPDVLGKTVSQEIYPGEPLQMARLCDPGASRKSDRSIPRGMRAVTLNADETTRMGGLLEPGSLVDVMLSPRGESDLGAVSRVVVQGVRVLALGEQTDTNPHESNSSTWSTFTLLLTSAEAAKVVGAVPQGKITLALRNGIDREIDPALVLTLPIKPTKNGGHVTHRDPARTQHDPFTVELISGGKHTSQIFAEVAQ